MHIAIEGPEFADINFNEIVSAFKDDDNTSAA